MDDGTRLAYCDPRRFGRIKLRGAEPEELAALAPDALEAPAVADMRERVELEVGSYQGRAARPVGRRLWHRQLGRRRSSLHVSDSPCDGRLGALGGPCSCARPS